MKAQENVIARVIRGTLTEWVSALGVSDEQVKRWTDEWFPTQRTNLSSELWQNVWQLNDESQEDENYYLLHNSLNVVGISENVPTTRER